jgi:signal transduction histidine kinase
MSIKSFSLITLFIFAIIQILLTCFGITLFNVYNNSVLREKTVLEIENVFKMHSSEIIGNVLLGNDEILYAKLSEVALDDAVGIQIYFGDKLRYASNQLDPDVQTVEITKPLSLGEHEVAHMTVKKSVNGLSKKSRALLLLFSVLPVIFLIIALTLMYHWTTSTIVKPLEASILNPEIDNQLINKNSPWIPTEIKSIDRLIKKLVSDIKVKSTFQAKYDLAQQLAHDIRAPISVIQEILKDEKNINVNSSLLKSAALRMQSIARDLLLDNRLIKTTNKESSFSSAYISAKEIIDEAKIIHNNMNIRWIFSCQNKKLKFSLARVDAAQLQRIIANLINNSTEAMQNTTRREIHLSILESTISGCIAIRISDTGTGISIDDLTQIGNRGFSTKNGYNIQSGSGIGLNHAKKYIEGIGGALTVESELGLGTSVTLNLPLHDNSEFFPEEFSIKDTSLLVVIDDEDTNLSVWQKKINNMRVTGNPMTVAFHSSSDEFEKNVPYYKQYENSSLFIFNYELGPNSLNGIDLIKKYNLQDRAILNSNRQLDENFIKDLENNKISFVSKALVSEFNLTDAKSDFPVSVSAKPILSVLIDDDPLIHAMWDFWAEKNNRSLLKFKGSQDLFAAITRIDKTAEFYIDYHIAGDLLNGEEIAKHLYDHGFLNLHICTGDELAIKNKPCFIKSVRGKTIC